jgi:hypothetical protein
LRSILRQAGITEERMASATDLPGVPAEKFRETFLISTLSEEPKQFFLGKVSVSVIA